PKTRVRRTEIFSPENHLCLTKSLLHEQSAFTSLTRCLPSVYPRRETVQRHMENRQAQEVAEDRQDCSPDEVQANASFNHLWNSHVTTREHNSVRPGSRRQHEVTYRGGERCWNHE